MSVEPEERQEGAPLSLFNVPPLWKCGQCVRWDKRHQRSMHRRIQLVLPFGKRQKLWKVRDRRRDPVALTA